MKPTFFEELLQSDRRLELDYRFACAKAPPAADGIRAATAQFLDGYARFNAISKEAAVASWDRTVRRYANDLRAFAATGRYPLELDPTQPPLERTDYDLFLILSILVTRHRCAIMEELAKLSVAGRTLAIGVGSGVELCFIGASGDACDLDINRFARKAHPGWTFREALFQPGETRYDCIYAIELLEHLADPYVLLADCRRALALRGRLVVTTATNVPQFDHRYNFVDEKELQQRAAMFGLRVVYQRIIPHAYPRTNIGAFNTFYVLQRGD